MRNNKRVVYSRIAQKYWQIFLFVFAAYAAVAEDPRKYIVDLKVAINRNPAEIKLSWTPDSAAGEYVVSRKDLNEGSWTPVVSLNGAQTAWTDKNVQPGAVYEYQVIKKTGADYTGYGYTSAAIDRPLIESRGKALLVVEQSLAGPLDFELKRFSEDLAGDGWTVAQQVVSASLTPPEVKALIAGEYNKEPRNLKSVILIGHVAVPYSGDIAPDKHPDHQGAWPADSYYADLNGDWTDSTLTSTTAARPANQNTPGDGKFDQSFIPSPVELQVGRIDLSWLTSFANKAVAKDEIDLTRQYFNKNHAFRHAQLPVQNKGLIYSDVATVPPEPAITYAFRTFSALMGGENVIPIEYNEFLPLTANDYYLWGAATSGGGWTYANGISGADELALYNMNVIFTFFCSSYFGDWNTESNYLRAILGTAGGPLTTAYGSRPGWLCHGMGVGETIGHATAVTMDNKEGGLYPPHLIGSGMVHTSLLGDPTLRMTPIAPPANLSGQVEDGKLRLSWSPSTAPSMARYFIYKSLSRSGPFVKIGETSSPTETSFLVQNAGLRDIFQVRAIALTTGNNGSYYNASQGNFYANNGIGPVGAPTAPKNTEVQPVSATSIRVRWVATSSNHQGFFIQRKAANESSFIEVGRAGFDKTEYVDNSLTAPNDYSYRVIAYNSGGVSDPSEPATGSNKIAESDFMFLDKTTQGNWKEKYGKSGYSLALQQTNLPPPVSITFSNYFTSHFGFTNNDVRLLAPVEESPDRAAAWWANGVPWGFDVDCKDEETRSIAFYFLDWNYKQRSFDIQAFDVTTKKLLFEQTVSQFEGGVYVVASVKGRVFFKITPKEEYLSQLLLGIFLDPVPALPAPQISPDGGTFAGRTQVSMSAPATGSQIRYTIDGSDPTSFSAIYSGPFTLATTATVKAKAFKPGYAPSSSVSAVFQNSAVTSLAPLGPDVQTKGGWQGVYGAEGYIMPELGSVPPAYSEFQMQNVVTWVWLAITSDSRGQIRPASTDRIAATWFSKDFVQFDLSVNDTRMHSLALYFLDWDQRGRKQTVEIFDMAGQLLDRTELSNFTGGTYLRYQVKGQIRCKISRVEGDNAVLNGLFFDEGPVEAPTAPVPAPPPEPPVQSSTLDADGQPVFTFAAETGRTICIDTSPDFKNWEHTGNRVVTDGKVQLKTPPSETNPHQFYRSHIVE